MPIYFGKNKITDIYKGKDSINKGYFSNNLVFIKGFGNTELEVLNNSCTLNTLQIGSEMIFQIIPKKGHTYPDTISATGVTIKSYSPITGIFKFDVGSQNAKISIECPFIITVKITNGTYIIDHAKLLKSQTATINLTRGKGHKLPDTITATNCTYSYNKYTEKIVLNNPTDENIGYEGLVITIDCPILTYNVGAYGQFTITNSDKTIKYGETKKFNISPNWGWSYPSNYHVSYEDLGVTIESKGETYITLHIVDELMEDEEDNILISTLSHFYTYQREVYITINICHADGRVWNYKQKSFNNAGFNSQKIGHFWSTLTYSIHLYKKVNTVYCDSNHSYETGSQKYTKKGVDQNLYWREFVMLGDNDVSIGFDSWHNDAEIYLYSDCDDEDVWVWDDWAS